MTRCATSRLSFCDPRAFFPGPNSPFSSESPTTLDASPLEWRPEAHILPRPITWLPFRCQCFASFPRHWKCLLTRKRRVVSWSWGGGQPGGEAVEVAEKGEIAIESKKGNTIKKNADPENPAVHVSREGNDVVKRASELEVEEEGDKHKEGGDDKKEDGEGEEKDEGEQGKKDDDAEKKDEDAEKMGGEDEKKESEEKEDDAKTGEKRKAEDDAEADEGASDAKKQKSDDEPKANGEEKSAPKKKGRPAKKDANGNANEKKESAKKKEPKKAATATGEPRRSGRNRS